MAVTTASIVNVAQALGDVIKALDIRVHWYVADTIRPPAVVIMQPSIDYTDTLGGFCSASWTFPLILVVARNNDKEAQVALSSMLQQVTNALAAAQVPGIGDMAPIDARPETVLVSNVEQPAYHLNVLVRV